MMYKNTTLAILFAGCTAAASTALANGECCPFSDERLKQDIKPLQSATADLLKLQGMRFTWKADGREDIGLVAQQVKAVYPELVHEKAGHLTVDYDKLIAPLIESQRELDQRITALEQAAVATQ